MPGGTRAMIMDAEQRFPIRVRVAVPQDGLGQRIHRMYAWLDETCGVDEWKSTPAGMRGIVTDAFAIWFRDPAFPAAFIARWCAGFASVEGYYRMREDDPAPRIPNPALIGHYGYKPS